MKGKQIEQTESLLIWLNKNPKKFLEIEV